MAFQPTNSRQEIQNRKILEELQIKKQLLLKQGAASALNTTPITPTPMPVGNTMLSKLAATICNYRSTHRISVGHPLNTMARLKLRALEEYLQTIKGFESPKLHLEQYITRPHIASHLLHTAQTTFDDLEGKIVADLGCGCGTLTLGAAALGASFTLGFEVDTDAIKVFRKNARRFGLPGQWGIKSGWQESAVSRKKSSSDQGVSDASTSDEDDASKDSGDESELSYSSSSDAGYFPDSSVDVVLCDVTSGDGLGSTSCRWHKLFDTVVMNPPFGTKNNQGIDMAFLRAALNMARTAVYTLHKTSTRSYVIAKGKEWGGRGTTAEVLAKLHFDLPKSYRFHNKKSVDIEVDFIRFGLNDANSCAHELNRAMKIR